MWRWGDVEVSDVKWNDVEVSDVEMGGCGGE